MTTPDRMPSHPVVSAFVDAVNAQDPAALWTVLAQDATVIDVGTERDLGAWVERELFSSHARMDVVQESPDGLSVTARFHNDIWGDIDTAWEFTVSDGVIRRFVAGPA
ncbi:nuclear transport factor 2 family protein [Streptomyces flavofungini]|uniref:nuclear transport factor 2 family protein n=1 Tax=Streptomyces flavofungini TaxID=68200 RepID=UPI0025B10427|nr:nuclear transport factor 2 family protein [Streptomyces flavofungini]WJV45034.1 nuclear transport factor 2 family protein [Streptomyces flavofungini]